MSVGGVPPGTEGGFPSPRRYEAHPAGQDAYATRSDGEHGRSRKAGTRRHRSLWATVRGKLAQAKRR